jgi:hypothetical protein
MQPLLDIMFNDIAYLEQQEQHFDRVLKDNLKQDIGIEYYYTKKYPKIRIYIPGSSVRNITITFKKDTDNNYEILEVRLMGRTYPQIPYEDLPIDFIFSIKDVLQKLTGKCLHDKVSSVCFGE